MAKEVRDCGGIKMIQIKKAPMTKKKANSKGKQNKK